MKSVMEVPVEIICKERSRKAKFLLQIENEMVCAMGGRKCIEIYNGSAKASCDLLH